MITINFAGRNYRLMARIFHGLVLTTVMLSGLMLFIVVKSLLLRRDIAALDRSVKESQAAEEQFRPLLAERDRIVKDLNTMAGLVQARSFSWTHMLTSLERAVPIGVALGKVEFDPKERMLTLEGAAQSPEALRNLMVGLERTPGFQEPYLKHQSLEKGIISFNVVTYYRETTTGAVAGGK